MAVTSTFDTDSDGWTVNGSDVATQNWSSTGGDPGGYYAWTDGAMGVTNYFVAPSKYLGDDSGYYGGTLSWSVLDNEFDTAGDAPDIKITGDGMTITRQILTTTTQPAGGQWTNLSASLSETGWVLVTGGAQPTAQQMEDILGDVTDIELLADYHNGVDVGGLDNVDLACFVTGTRIGTTRGEIPVEHLAGGDHVITAAGRAKPVRWIGRRTIDRGRHPRPGDVGPVRIAAHAFGHGLPSRELFLSPGHPVLVGADEDQEGGHLVPIMCLVNGTTIERVAVDEVTYWHVELDAHDVLLAEGLPAESYFACGDRGFFGEGSCDRLDSPDFVSPEVEGRCRPVAVDGPVVTAERRRLDRMFDMRLATACAWPTELWANALD